MPNSIIVNYSAVQKILINASQKYLDDREKNKKPNYIDLGWHHGKKGIVRAKNLNQYAKIKMHELCILALAMAAFHTSSSWLTFEIASQLINNKEAFNKEKIQKYSVKQYHTQMMTNHIWVPVEVGIDKRMTVKVLLEKALEEELNSHQTNQITKDQFNLKIKAFKKIVDAKLEMTEIDLNHASFV